MARHRAERLDLALGVVVVAGIGVASSRAALFDRVVDWVVRHRRWRMDDLILTGAAATIVGAVLAQRHTKRIVRRLHHASRTDALTGLPNRALLMERIEHGLTRRRRGTELAVYFLDLDGYKQVNDRWGHATGDAVLLEIADRLQASVRTHDTVSRVGGDEFVVLASPRTTPAQDATSIRCRPASVWRSRMTTGTPQAIGWREPMRRCMPPSAPTRTSASPHDHSACGPRAGWTTPVVLQPADGTRGFAGRPPRACLLIV